MSDISLLSSRYQRLSELTQQINRSILTLKKQRALAMNAMNITAQLYPAVVVTLEEVTEAKALLSRFLEGVEQLLRSSETASLLEQDYSHRLKERVVTDDQVLEVRQSLMSASPLNERQLNLLDLLLYLLDDERTNLFHQLRTSRRG
ncbi:hypothetical protein [Spirosoma pollinicola]|uniref:Uncharacterized protein n=1 Tax=Spirosoma pollinicola TaxID=2057025 RepID=A0A2K8Z2A2_9BACT|nr:hypothetical protein [Spirosoma pollinicola]AUD04016.1 hypothetical protein CWM47_20610 [Spirosoma pollinicola]